jgi:hypothetical protein
MGTTAPYGERPHAPIADPPNDQSDGSWPPPHVPTAANIEQLHAATPATHRVLQSNRRISRQALRTRLKNSNLCSNRFHGFGVSASRDPARAALSAGGRPRTSRAVLRSRVRASPNEPDFGRAGRAAGHAGQRPYDRACLGEISRYISPRSRPGPGVDPARGIRRVGGQRHSPRLGLGSGRRARSAEPAHRSSTATGGHAERARGRAASRASQGQSCPSRGRVRDLRCATPGPFAVVVFGSIEDHPVRLEFSADPARNTCVVQLFDVRTKMVLGERVAGPLFPAAIGAYAWGRAIDALGAAEGTV